MTLRKKHLKIGALILLGICVLGGIALGVLFSLFHKEKSEPEPPVYHADRIHAPSRHTL